MDADRTVSYMIIRGGTPTELEARVQKKMNDGWKCAGGVSHYQSPSDNSFHFFIQAMTYAPGATP